jgi:CzcA family heavy metal efflux pump
MMRWIIGSSLRLRLVIVGIAALLLVFGFTQINEVPVDALPEFSRPYVEIQTEALGLSAQEVEALITTPLEADLLNGVSWVEEIRSESLPGLSSIVMVFEKGTDIMRARQMVQERLLEIYTLPNVSTPPTMLNPLSSASRFLEIGLTSDELSLIEMSVLARWTIVPRLMGIPGVANVSIWGQRKRQLQVLVDSDKLRQEGITLMQIIRTTGNALWVSPLSFLEASTPGTGGWIDTPNQRLGIRHILPIKTAEDLGEVSIEGALTKRLADVATLVENHQPLIGDAFVNDEPALMLVVERFPWANTTEVTQDVEEALIALQPGLAGINMDTSLFRPATFLDIALKNLSTALIMGAVFMLLALFAFFFNWRSALISIVAILLSVITAGTVLYLSNVDINLMVIAGLIIALAAIIDNAVIDVNNIVRRFRESKENGNSRSTATLIYEAAVEMRMPIFYAAAIMALVVTPIFFLEGVSGAFFKPVALSFIVAMFSSIAVALTVTPALSYLMLRNANLENSNDSSPVRLLQNLFEKVNSGIITKPRLVFGVVCVLVVIGIVSLPLLRQESLLPDFKETDLVIRWEGSTSASHPAMRRITTMASRELRALPGVRNVSAQVGRAIMSDKRKNINSGELRVSIDPAADYDATVASVKKIVAGYPGFSPQVLTYLQAKVREELSGTGESLVVRVYGEEMDVIRQKAEEVQKVLARTEGVVDATVEYPQEMPTLEIEVNLEKVKEYGLKPGDVRRAATTLVSGLLVGSIFDEQKVFDVMVFGTPETRHSVNSIENILIDTQKGGHVRLKDVADIRIATSPTVIHRDAVARRMDVTANVRGRDLAAVAADVQFGIRQIKFPLEYRAELLGEYAERLAAQNRLRGFTIAAIIGIFLLLQAFFRSWRMATTVFLTLPMALLGGILTVLITSGGLLSFGSIIGFIAIFGIAVRNSITLVNRYQYLEEQGENFGPDLVKRVTQERFVPIVMTAVTTILAILPLAILGNLAGLEIMHPMAMVMVGGLISSTLFTLFGVPAIYLVFGAEREPIPVTDYKEAKAFA